ncbi:MAG: conjugal transfer protein TraN [Nitrospiria bacterium]
MNRTGFILMMVLILSGVGPCFIGQSLAFDPYAAAQSTVTSSVTSTTPSGWTGYTSTTTISPTSASLITSGLGSLALSGATTYSPSSTVGSVFATQGSNPIKIPPGAAFLAPSMSLATNGTSATSYLNSQGVVTLPATTNATQFTVFPGSGTPTTVCTSTTSVTNTAVCNVNTTYNYNSCNINQGTAIAVPCVSAPASATTSTVVGTTITGTPISIIVSMASQCPGSFSFGSYSGLFAMTAADTSTVPITAAFTISTLVQTIPVAAFTMALATGVHSFNYTGGCTGPIGGVQSCTYQFVDATTGVPLAPLTFSYTPPSGAFKASLTDTCTPWEASVLSPPAVCSPSTPCCTLSTTACSNNTPIAINGVSVLPPTGCWTTQNTYSCNVGTDASACTSLIAAGYTTSASSCVLTDSYGNCMTLQKTMTQSTSACLSTSTTVTGGGPGTTPVVVCDTYAPSIINTTCNITFSYTYPYCDIYYGTVVTTPCIASPAWSTPWINDGAGSFLFSFPSQCPSFYFNGTMSYSGGGSWTSYLPTWVVPDTSPTMLAYSWWSSSPSFYYYVWVSGGCTGAPGTIQTCNYKFWTSNASAMYSYALAYTTTVQYTPPGAYVSPTVTDNCTILATTPSCTLGSATCVNPWPVYVSGLTLYPPGGCWDVRKYFYCFLGKNTSACDTLTAAGYVTMSAGTCISYDAYGNCLVLQYKMNKTVEACVLSHTISMATLTIQGGCSSSATSNCVSQPPPASGTGSMTQTIAQLQAAFALKSSFSGSPPMFFSGTAMQCGSSGVYNCCANSPSILNPSCNTMEQNLAAYRSAGECTFVGGYCSYSIDPCSPLGSCTICLQNTDVYCCFTSQLGDIIQNGAHSQLGIPWVTGGLSGGANCGPISSTQLMSLNFSLMDFSPIFSQVNANMATATSSINAAIFGLTSSTASTTSMCPTCP